MTRRPQNSPAPADWATNCLVMGIRTIRDHYRTSSDNIARWCRETGVYPMTRRNRPKTTVPADFAHWAAIEKNVELQVRYDCSNDVVVRWRKATGVHHKFVPDRTRAVPSDFAAIAPTMIRERLAAHYKVDRKLLGRWIAQTGVQPMAFKRPRSAVHALPTPMAPQIDASIAGQAQRHLQRITPVYRGGDGYMVGGRSMATEAMIAMAQAKGFDPTAWARI